MKYALSVALPLAGFLALAACAAKPPVTVQPPPPPPQAAPPADLVILLADPDGSVGAADVSNPLGTTSLTAVRSATRLAPGQSPTPVEEISEAEVQQIFGDTLAALPPPPQRFSLYFRFESEELTPASRADIPKVLAAVKSHPAPEVLVAGHTDTAGAAKRNLELGLRRAIVVRDLLVASKLDRSTIEIASHGEADPLIKTADDVSEPRNRRVDITVR